MLHDVLAGMKVLDLTQMLAGPTATMLLTDLGAEVVKIESPTGDFARYFGPPFQEGQSVTFMALNRDKRSIALDLKVEDDAQVLRGLLEEADILVESFRPGVMERLGFGYEAVSAINPALIYCSVSAYGQRSKAADRPGVDGIMQGVSGLMSIIGRAGDPPTKVQDPVVDSVTGYLSTIALLAAVMDRGRTGRGTHLDISMLGSALQLQQSSLVAYVASGEIAPPSGSAAPYAAPNEAFPTSDGWIMLAAYQPARWIVLCSTLGRDDLVDHPLFATMELRIANRPAMHAELSRTLGTRTSAEWLDVLTRAGIMCGPVNDYATLMADRDLEVGDLIDFVDHPVAGSVPVLRSVIATADGHARRDRETRPAPLLGQDNDAPPW